MTTDKSTPVTIKHGEEGDRTKWGAGGIPPYEISEWAEDKTVEQLYAELERRKGVARVTTGLLDHEYATLEWLAAEKRQLVGRSAADVAADPTEAERKAFSDAATPYYLAKSQTQDAQDAREAALRARIEASQSFGSQSFGASFPEAERRKLIEAEEDAKAALEEARKREGVLLIAFNRTQADNAAASQARRREAQAGINREGFLANAARYGATVDKADVDHHYPKPGRLTAALTRVMRRRRP